MTILTQTQTSVKTEFFNIVREGDQYFLITPQPAEYQMKSYRFRHHGAKKYVHQLEAVAGTEVQRQAISKTAAQALANEAYQQKRIQSYCHYDTDSGEKRWDMRIVAGGQS